MGELGGVVTNGSGAPVGGVAADLFLSNRAGERLGYLRSTSTSTNGDYRFTVTSGCYVVTLLAPADSQFTNGQPWLNLSGCVNGGERVTSLNASLAGGNGGPASIGDSVTYTNGSPASGVNIDLFAAAADGSRSTYLESTTTNSNGNYSFTANPGCYVVTFVAPNGEDFTNGSGWLNTVTCLDPGEQENGVDAVIIGGGSVATINGVVTRNGNPVSGVGVDLFITNADGSRGPWVTNTRTGSNGAYTHTVMVGCHTLTFIAPNGQTFTNASPWLNQTTCVEAGEAVQGVNAQLR